MGRKRNKTAALLAHFDQAERAIFVIDRSLSMVYCNKACGQWLGRPANELIAQPCLYRAIDDHDEFSNALPLAPPPSVWESDATVCVPMTLGDISNKSRQVQFIPLQTAGVTQAVLAIASTADGNTGEASDDPTAAVLHDRLLQFRRETGQRFRLHALIGNSPAMSMLREQVRVAGDSRANVLLIGEPGSGRQRLARTIHYADHRQASSIASIACPITDAEMLQSAIKAFVRRREELGETEPGTMILLDVDQLPASAQHELIGFLKLPGFHIRLIGTARRPLIELAEADEFDRGLAYRLSTLTIPVPPLRQRRSDIGLLAQHFVEQFNRSDSMPGVSGFSSEALDLLTHYDWPHNLPQLREAVAHARAHAAGSIIAADDLPAFLSHAAEAAKHVEKTWEPIELDKFLESIETELIQQALAYCGGNKTKAAPLLGISRARLIRRVQQLGLEPGIDFEEIE